MTHLPDEEVSALFEDGRSWEHPARLADLYVKGKISRAALAHEIWGVWRYRPDGSAVMPATWQEMFRAAGYQQDGVPCRRPWLARRLYRGAVAEARFGLSWTTNPGVAKHFADSRQEPGRRGQVWTAVVHPRRFLAHGTDEREYVVDTTGLDIVEFDATGLTGWIEHPRWPHRLRGT